MNRPRGLWLLVGGVVAGLAGVGWLWPSTESAEPSADEVVSTPTASAEPYLFVGPPDHGGENGEHRWTEDAWRPVAVGFARDFADPGKSLRDWQQRVGQWVSDHLAEQYEHTARYRIPVADLGRVVGPKQARQAVIVTAVYKTGLVLSLHLEVFPATGWKVTQAMPTEATGDDLTAERSTPWPPTKTSPVTSSGRSSRPPVRRSSDHHRRRGRRMGSGERLAARSPRPRAGGRRRSAPLPTYTRQIQAAGLFW